MRDNRDVEKNAPRAVACALAALAACGHAHAQESETIIVTGSRLDRAAANSHEIGADSSMPGASDPVRVLSGTPGVSVSAPTGAVGEVYVRGADPNFAVVLIDGVRVNDPTNTRGGGYDFSGLAGDEIARVEVVRGSLSAVHGSDAMAGVISVETWDDAEGARVRAQVGERGYGRAFFAAALPYGLSVSAARQDMGDLGAGARQELTTAAVRGRAGAWSAGLRYAERDRSGFPDASGGPLFAVNRALETAASEDVLAWSRFRDAGIDASLSYFTRSEAVATPAVAPGVFDGAPASASDTDFSRVAASLAVSGALAPHTRYSIGGAFEHERGDRRGFLYLGPVTLPSDFELTRDVAAVFAETQTAFGAGWTADLALRLDSRDGADARASGRAALRYEQGRLAWGANWANGHKAPSLYALGDALVGNPDLRDEAVTAAETYMAWRADGWRLQASVFASRFTDLIDFDFATFRLVNRDVVRIEGVEIEAEFALTAQASLRVFAAASDIDVDGAGTLLNRPETYGGAALTWRGREWTGDINATLAGDRPGASAPTGERTLEAYARFDLELARRLNEHAALFVALDNLTDVRIEDAAGFPAPGRAMRVGVALRVN